jgi:hypothetical protein
MLWLWTLFQASMKDSQQLVSLQFKKSSVPCVSFWLEFSTSDLVMDSEISVVYTNTTIVRKFRTGISFRPQAHFSEIFLDFTKSP